MGFAVSGELVGMTFLLMDGLCILEDIFLDPKQSSLVHNITIPLRSWKESGIERRRNTHFMEKRQSHFRDFRNLSIS